MKTKIKLNRSEYKALYATFKQLFPADNVVVASTLQQMLFRSILQGVFKKLHIKEYDVQTAYSFTLKQHEAIAFYLFFKTAPLNRFSYEGNLIAQISDAIHKDYSQHLLS